MGVTTKTIRNRIEDKRLEALWYEIGPGQSRWLISKEIIKAIVSREGNTSPQLSLPTAFIDEIKAQMREENKVLRQEMAEIRMAQQEIAESQELLGKSLLERDEKLLAVIRERMENRQSQKQNQSSWWKFWG